MCAAKVAAAQNNDNNFNMLMKQAGGYMTAAQVFLRHL
jgi:hypothetical protein